MQTKRNVGAKRNAHEPTAKELMEDNPPTTQTHVGAKWSNQGVRSDEGDKERKKNGKQTK